MGDFEACRFDFRLDAKNGLTPSKRKKSERRGTCYNTLFKCKICGSLFDHRAALLEHKMLHNEFKCPICDLKVTRKVTLKEHLSVIHGLGRTKADFKVAQQAAKLAELAAGAPAPPTSSSELSPVVPASSVAVPSSPAVITSPSTMPGYMCINIPLLMPPSSGQQENTTVVSSASYPSMAMPMTDCQRREHGGPFVTNSSATVQFNPQLIGEPPVSNLSSKQVVTSSGTPVMPRGTPDQSTAEGHQSFGNLSIPDMDDLEPGEIRPIYRKMYQAQMTNLSSSAGSSSPIVQHPGLTTSPSTAAVPVAAVQPTSRVSQPQTSFRSESVPAVPIFVPNVSSESMPGVPQSSFGAMNIPVQPLPYQNFPVQALPPQASGSPLPLNINNLANVEPINITPCAVSESGQMSASPLPDSGQGEPRPQDHLRLPVFIAAPEQALPNQTQESSTSSTTTSPKSQAVETDQPLDLSSSCVTIAQNQVHETANQPVQSYVDITSEAIVERIRAMERIARQEGFGSKWRLGKIPQVDGVPNIGSGNPLACPTIPVFKQNPYAPAENPFPAPVYQSEEPRYCIKPIEMVEAEKVQSSAPSPALSDSVCSHEGTSSPATVDGADGSGKSGGKKRPKKGLNSMVAHLWQTKIQRNSMERDVGSGSNRDSPKTDDDSVKIVTENPDNAPLPQSPDSSNMPSPINIVPIPDNVAVIPLGISFQGEHFEGSSVSQMDGAGDSHVDPPKSLQDINSSDNDLIIGEVELPQPNDLGVLDLTVKTEKMSPETVILESSDNNEGHRGRPRIEKMPINRDPPKKRQKRDFYTVKFHTCKICRQLFDSAEKMWEHALQHEDFYKQKCSTLGCDFATLSKAELVQHRSEVHGEAIPDPLSNPDGKEYVCSYCGKALSSASSLYHHVTRHAHEKQYVCEYDGCTWRFFTSRELKLHVDKVHLGKKANRRFSCPREGCSREFTMLDRLKRHLLSHATKPQQVFVCPEPGCDRSFRYQKRLDMHQEEHSGPTPEQCVLCEFSCKQQVTLTWHMKTKHGLGKLKTENLPDGDGYTESCIMSGEDCENGDVEKVNDLNGSQVMDTCVIKTEVDLPQDCQVETGQSESDGNPQGIDKEAFYAALNLKLKSKVEAKKNKERERAAFVAGQAFSVIDGQLTHNNQLATMMRWRWATFGETPVTSSAPVDQKASMSHWRWAPHDRATAMARNGDSSPGKEHQGRPMEGKLHCCKLCKQLFVSAQKLWSHRLAEHDDVGQLFCDRCSYSTRRRQELEDHCLAEHGSKPSSLKRIVCLTCGREYSSRHGLRQHQWKHHRNGNPDYPCPQDGCCLSFPSRAALKSHFQLVHPKAPGTELQCKAEGCKKVFESSSALRSHQVIHLDQRPLVCDFPGCEKAFRETKHLKVHKMLHTDEKPLKCSLCDYSCRQRNSLNWHMKSKHNLQKQVTADGRTIYV